MARIDFHFETEFILAEKAKFSKWIREVIVDHGFVPVEIGYVFCEDEYLLRLNREYLNHNTYTDIITFDYSEGKCLLGDIFISVERVRENAKKYAVGFENELARVMGHGILHLMGYDDKTEEDKCAMRKKENELIKTFHVEH